MYSTLPTLFWRFTPSIGCGLGLVRRPHNDHSPTIDHRLMMFYLIDSQAKVSVLLAKFQPWSSARNWPQAHFWPLAHDNLSVALDGRRPMICTILISVSHCWARCRFRWATICAILISVSHWMALWPMICHSVALLDPLPLPLSLGNNLCNINLSVALDGPLAHDLSQCRTVGPAAAFAGQLNSPFVYCPAMMGLRPVLYPRPVPPSSYTLAYNTLPVEQ